MKKPVAFCALLFLSACASSTQVAMETPPPSDADLQARDECLQDYVCSAATAGRRDQAKLQAIGVSAERKCSGQVEAKILGHFGPERGADLVARDQEFTQRRVMVLVDEPSAVCHSN